MTRPAKVYRLEIVYPEGCRLPGWHPAIWTDPGWLRGLDREQRRQIRALLRKPFKWPRERLFLSSSGAYGRAALLQAYGAEVEVRASLPVAWPNPELDVCAEECCSLTAVYTQQADFCDAYFGRAERLAAGVQDR